MSGVRKGKQTQTSELPTPVFSSRRQKTDNWRADVDGLEPQSEICPHCALLDGEFVGGAMACDGILQRTFMMSHRSAVLYKHPQPAAWFMAPFKHADDEKPNGGQTVLV